MLKSVSPAWTVYRVPDLTDINDFSRVLRSTVLATLLRSPASLSLVQPRIVSVRLVTVNRTKGPVRVLDENINAANPALSVR